MAQVPASEIGFVQLCPEGVWGPRLRSESEKHVWGEKNVWGRRPRTFFSLFVRNVGPQTLFGHNLCAIVMCFYYVVYLLAYLGELTALNVVCPARFFDLRIAKNHV